MQILNRIHTELVPLELHIDLRLKETAWAGKGTQQSAFKACTVQKAVRYYIYKTFFALTHIIYNGGHPQCDPNQHEAHQQQKAGSCNDCPASALREIMGIHYLRGVKSIELYKNVLKYIYRYIICGVVRRRTLTTSLSKSCTRILGFLWRCRFLWRCLKGDMKKEL